MVLGGSFSGSVGGEEEGGCAVGTVGDQGAGADLLSHFQVQGARRNGESIGDACIHNCRLAGEGCTRELKRRPDWQTELTGMWPGCTRSMTSSGGRSPS